MIIALMVFADNSTLSIAIHPDEPVQETVTDLFVQFAHLRAVELIGVM